MPRILSLLGAVIIISLLPSCTPNFLYQNGGQPRVQRSHNRQHAVGHPPACHWCGDSYKGTVGDVPRKFPLHERGIEPAFHEVELPPLTNQDTGYAERGPVFGGSQLPERRETSTEWALHYRSVSERLTAEAAIMKDRVAQLDAKVVELSNSMTIANSRADDTHKQLLIVEEKLRNWQQQTVLMYGAAKRDEEQMLRMLRDLTSTVNHMITIHSEGTDMPAISAGSSEQKETAPPHELTK